MRERMRWVLGIVMCAIGSLHFALPDMFVSIMPPYLPWHLGLVYVSGAIEIALGVALMLPATQRLAAWALIALFVAVYPANIHMAMHDVTMRLPAGMPPPEPWMAWARLPLQFVLIYWAYQYTKRDAPLARAQ